MSGVDSFCFVDFITSIHVQLWPDLYTIELTGKHWLVLYFKSKTGVKFTLESIDKNGSSLYMSLYVNIIHRRRSVVRCWPTFY